MSQFESMQLTNQGLELLARVQAGTTLHFTKIKIGDGDLPMGQDLRELDDLVHTVKELDITSVVVEGRNCRLKSSLMNGGITEGYYINEIGVFANDPQYGEILYAVSRAVVPEFLPSEQKMVVNNQFEIVLIMSETANVTASIAMTGYVTVEQMEYYVDLRLREYMYGLATQGDIQRLTIEIEKLKSMIPDGNSPSNPSDGSNFNVVDAGSFTEDNSGYDEIDGDDFTEDNSGYALYDGGNFTEEPDGFEESSGTLDGGTF